MYRAQQSLAHAGHVAEAHDTEQGLSHGGSPSPSPGSPHAILSPCHPEPFYGTCAHLCAGTPGWATAAPGAHRGREVLNTSG